MIWTFNINTSIATLNYLPPGHHIMITPIIQETNTC